MLKVETLKITPEILSLISEIDEFKGAWKALGSLEPERLNALRSVATIESIGSSTRIEGSKLSNKEIEKLLLNIKIQSFASRDEEEVAGYAKVMDLIFSSWEEIPISENHIRQLHRDLLSFSEKDKRHRGSYKTNSNSIAAFDDKGNQIGVVFKTATPFATPRYMAELVSWYKKECQLNRLHPLLKISIFIVVFLEIHPFQDGNGRLSRALTTLMLLQSGYTYAPFSSLESVIEESKEAYYFALRKTQKTIRMKLPDWGPWVLFFLKALQQQKIRLSKKIEREKIVLSKLPELSLKIIDFTRDHGRVTIGDMVRLSGASRNTLKEHFRSLVQKKHLVQNGVGKGTWYTLI